MLVFIAQLLRRFIFDFSGHFSHLLIFTNNELIYSTPGENLSNKFHPLNAWQSEPD